MTFCTIVAFFIERYKQLDWTEHCCVLFTIYVTVFCITEFVFSLFV